MAAVVAVLAAVLAVLGPASTAGAADDGGFAAHMLDLVNQQRAAAGVAPVVAVPALATIAQDGQYTGCGFTVSGRANDLGVRNYFSHTILGCGTQTVFNMMNAAGIASSASGENIAWVSAMTDPLLAAERLMNDFMASPGHRDNILNPSYNAIGIGSWHTAAGQSWSGGGTALTNVYIAVQVFGHLASVPPPSTAAPTAVSATGADGSIGVAWHAAGTGPAVDSYGAFAWDSTGYTGHYAVACATCTSATITGLTDGATYYVTVFGHNAAGWGTPGLSGWVTVAAAPGPATAVTAVPANGALTTTWRAPTTAGAAVDGYAVLVFDANGYTNQYAWVCATCTTATVTGLTNGHSYYAAVYPHNPNTWGTAAASGWIVAGTPGPPPAVTTTRASGSVAASWSPAPSSGAAVDLYGVFAFDAGGYTGQYATACPTCTSAPVTGLTNGHPYLLAVYAHNAFGWGAPILSTSVTPG